MATVTVCVSVSFFCSGLTFLLTSFLPVCVPAFVFSFVLSLCLAGFPSVCLPVYLHFHRYLFVFLS